jgi:hypothetical protein
MLHPPRSIHAWLGILLLALMPTSAWAAVEDFVCLGGKAYGTLYDSGNGACPDTMNFSNVFSFLICHTEQLSANLMGNMYCGVMTVLQPMVTAAVTLAVVIFGISFTLGFSQITAQEFQKFLLKIAVVYAFATQSDLLIGFGYNLLITGLREGTAIAISALYNANGTITDGMSVYAMLDKFLATALHMATDNVGQEWTKDHNPCQNAVFAAMAIMAIAFPPIFYIGMSIIIRIGLTFIRAIFGYIYAIIGITFLLTLAPFFLSFYLFQLTSSYYDKWLGYLVSFSLQLVIVFAFLAFVLSIKVDNVTSSVSAIIVPAAHTTETTSIRLPWQYCTLCEFDVVHKDSGAVMQDNDPEFLSKGKLQCRDNPPKPISVLQGIAPPDSAAVANSLMKFAAGGLISLLVLAYIVDTLVGKIPGLAQTLASSFNSSSLYATQLVSGDQMGQAPMIDMPGGGMVNTLDRGFRDGFSGQNNTVTGVVEGFKKATERIVLGGGNRRGVEDEGEGVNDPGLRENFISYLMNPQRRNNE